MFLRRWDPGIQREEQNGLDHHQEGSIGKIRKRQGVLGRRYNLGSRWILLQKGNMETGRSQKSSRSVEWIEISIIIQAKAQNQVGTIVVIIKTKLIDIEIRETKERSLHHGSWKVWILSSVRFRQA